MNGGMGPEIGTVVGSTSPQEFQFYLRSFSAKLGDLVSVSNEVPDDNTQRKRVVVWGRITSMTRYNPFLPSEAGLELAEEGLDLVDTVLSNSRDQIEGTVLILGATTGEDYQQLVPLSYPVQPGAVVRRPPANSVRTILTGDESTHRLNIGTLIGRNDVPVSLKTNVVVARHMAILAMTGGGKTVAARRVMRELIAAEYPIVVLDPHGDYLGVWENRSLLQGTVVKLYFPHIQVSEQNRDVISYLVSQMTQGFTDPQKEMFGNALEQIRLNEDEEIPITNFLGKILSNLPSADGQRARTVGAVRRGLRMVRQQMEGMMNSNHALRRRLRNFDFEPMPDPLVAPERFVRPRQVSILYLGGYDHLTQSTIVSLVLRHLYETRASMQNTIPPFLAVVEEAHNFIPSRGEGQSATPSVDIIRKVITEGRKFGVGLLLISQRPSRLDETTLSQCNTFLVFRLVNPRDQSFVERVMENLSRADSKLLPGFGPGQGIVSGQAVRFPLLVRIDFDEDLQPSTIGDEDFLEAVRKWNTSKEAAASDRASRLDEQFRSVDEFDSD